METLENRLRRTWRTAGYWGLTINVVGIPGALVVVPIYFPKVDLELVSIHFPVMLAAWVGAAAVRQWGKNTNRVPNNPSPPSQKVVRL